MTRRRPGSASTEPGNCRSSPSSFAKAFPTRSASRAHADLFGAVLDRLNGTPGLTGFLVFGDVRVLIERPTDGQTMLDSTLADPAEWNADHHLESALARGIVTDLVDFE